MKKTYLLPLALLALIALAPLAQAGKCEASSSRCEKSEKVSSLTPEEHKQLRAAHKAAKEDPKTQAAKARLDTAHKSHSEARRAAIAAVDPTLWPVLSKLPADGGRKFWKAIKELPEEEREQLKEANRKVEAAGTLRPAKEEQQAAMKEFRDTLKAAMLAADPAVEPLIEKREQDKKARRSERSKKSSV